ncbi:hypothetical protein [Nonomuraea sp. NPDC048901]|uniref:hypothetical protein n=1 Tax=Nonomuraea sp. NPDC048901 TaxID=3155627 RepID=UPI0033F60286
MTGRSSTDDSLAMTERLSAEGSGSMTGQLFRVELRRMARHPLVWGMAALVLAVQLRLSRDQQPDLTVDPVHATGIAACLAGALLVVASLAVSRDGRHRMPELLAGLPGRAEVRTRAVLFAAVVVAVVGQALVVGGYLLVRALSGPAGGRLDMFEPLTALGVGALAATLGVAVGRWVSWLIAGPVVVAGLGLLIFFNTNPGTWWLPVMQTHWMDWPDRPTGPHLVYVLALAVLAGLAALLRHGRRPVTLVAAVVALAVAVPAGATAAAVRPVALFPTGRTLTIDDVDTRVREKYFGRDAYRCERREGVRYCALSDYASWIPLWAGVVAPIVRAVPPDARVRVPLVKQYTSNWWYTNEDRVAIAPMAWGASDQRKLLAQSVALDIIDDFDNACDARGQARMVVALWLMGQASAIALPQETLNMDGRTALRSLIDYGDSEIGYAKLLLQSSGARERVWTNWDTLMRPATTVEQALPLLGLPQRYPISKPKGTPCR